MYCLYFLTKYDKLCIFFNFFVNTKNILSQNNGMRTSTKILIVITIILFIPNLFLTKYLLAAVVPTGEGFELNFTPLAWVSLSLQILYNIFFTILFVRFLKTQRLSNMIFFSLAPLTLVYGAFMIYIVAVKNMTGVMAESIRATLNIQTQETSYNNFLWAGLATLIYLVLLFLIVVFSCRPLSKVEHITQKLGDGSTKNDNFRIGGGKQFKEIEHSLNKINYNYREKENKIKQINLSTQKFIPKQFLKFLGKNGVEELELGNHVSKKATILFCKLKSSVNDEKTLSLEENFNYINSYLKIVSPLIKRYNGFIDKYLGDGVLAVFSKSENAIECSHAILRAIEIKNKSQKDFPLIDARISIITEEVVFGIVGDDERKNPTIISDIVNLSAKIQEINNYIDTKLLISKQSLNELSPKFDFDYRYTGDLSLDEGRQISLFESLDYYPKNKREKLKKLKNKFESGVRAYNEKKYEEAKEIFSYVLHQLPDDKPAFVYFNKASEKLKDH